MALMRMVRKQHRLAVHLNWNYSEVLQSRNFRTEDLLEFLELEETELKNFIKSLDELEITLKKIAERRKKKRHQDYLLQIINHQKEFQEFHRHR